MNTAKELVEQFRRDAPRLDLHLSRNDNEPSYLLRPCGDDGDDASDEKKADYVQRELVFWWANRFTGGTPGDIKALPPSLAACMYWCTQSAMADFYISFVERNGMLTAESDRHLLDDGKQTVRFKANGLVDIRKPFRESEVSASGERVRRRWQLHVTADIFADEPRVAESVSWQEDAAAPWRSEHAVLAAATFTAAAVLC
jgi:hypothetical protein